MVRLSRKTCICAAALVCMSTMGGAQPYGSLEYLEPYCVEKLCVGMPVAPQSWQYKRYNCRPSEQYVNSTWCSFKEPEHGAQKALTILHLANNIATYINKELSPAIFTKAEVDKQIERLSRQFDSPPHIYRSPKRPGFPQGIIVTWGEVQLQQLNRDDLAMLAEGKSPRLGVMVDYLVNFYESARAGFPVYSLGGGKGYVWIARFDKKGKEKLRFFAADPSQMKLIAQQPDYSNERESIAPPTSPRSAPSPDSPPRQEANSSGTGFLVSSSGYVLTNSHVVENCSRIEATPDGAPSKRAEIVARDRANDLALLKLSHVPKKFAVLRRGARLGESVAAFGFPLTGLLSPSGNFTLGNVTALTGLANDSRYVQISAPVQPGNSGGPLLDENGNVVGIITGKLDALKLGIIIGDLPQNVNFAINGSLAITFLEANRVALSNEIASTPLSPPDLAEGAREITVFIRCF